MSESELRIFALPLERALASCAGWESLLAPDERARAQRAATPLLRARFVSGRARLRVLLGALLGTRAASVRLRTTPRGKPELDQDPPPLRFNLSHAGDLAFVAVSRTCRLGIDLERSDRPARHAQAVRRLLAPSERSGLYALTDPARAEQLARCWVRKEALGKALGLGLDDALADAEVWRPAPGPTIVWMREPGALRRTPWQVDAIPAPPGHVAALCCEEAIPMRRILVTLVDEMLPGACDVA